MEIFDRREQVIENVGLDGLIFHPLDGVGETVDLQRKAMFIRRQLPQNVEDPIIQTFDPNERPIMSIAVQSAERPIRELTSLTDEVIATRVEAIPGVGGVNIVGGNARQIRVQLEVAAKYAGYIERQEEEIERHRRHEETRLPPDLDYARVAGLSNEVRQKLAQVKPETVGQAARVPGVTPAAVSILLVHLKKLRAA